MDTETRIIVLERLAEDIAKRQDRFEEHHTMLVSRLDEHLVRDGNTHTEITRILSHLSTSFESLADTMKSMGEGTALAIKHETMLLTVTKIGSIIAIFVAGAWAVFTWLSK